MGSCVQWLFCIDRFQADVDGAGKKRTQALRGCNLVVTVRGSVFVEVHRDLLNFQPVKDRCQPTDSSEEPGF